MLGIDVGHEGHVHAFGLRPRAAASAVRRGERRANQQGSEVGAADAEVDDRADRTSRRAEAQAAPDLRRERLHLRLRGANVGHDIVAIDQKRRVARSAQRRVQRGPAFRLVHLFAGEERRDPAFELRGARMLDEQCERLGREALLGHVEEPVVPCDRQAIEAIGIARE